MRPGVRRKKSIRRATRLGRVGRLAAPASLFFRGVGARPNKSDDSSQQTATEQDEPNTDGGEQGTGPNGWDRQSGFRMIRNH
jgi:hypothetical protein